MARVLNSSYSEMVEKAQEIFWLKGFKGISVKDLSAELDISHTVLYNKYSKDMLFLDSLDYYTTNYSDPFLRKLRESTEGLESLKDFFYKLIEALLDKTFPRSCLMVNTVVELRNENEDIVKRYDEYLKVLRDSYLVVLEKAYHIGQFKNKARINEYADFLVGIIFSMSILYKIRPVEELHSYIDEQLAFIV
ncbi:TetR/AcrR family transcriptional regulator [Lutimonas saemankumensis]|uniref:TetR/AcrR family transcriptional regulator n=1 Tax=Lutimonas saemankumensis TaxID=483016 RepID=UPI001CD4380F|nr:TetR/AcrR family transcriptional regulator [Lutimonas saemankumensis]MCA0931277.1 TetR/AcrR family transcriptional regulator [Lutimonas saemankumensis]